MRLSPPAKTNTMLNYILVSLTIMVFQLTPTTKPHHVDIGLPLPEPVKPLDPLPMPESSPAQALQPVKPVAKPQPKTEPVVITGGDMPAILIKIRGCESGHNYTAQNKSSTASGAYQFLRSTWTNYKGYVNAKDAPPNIQDERAIIEYQRNGTRPWNPSRSCWG